MRGNALLALQQPQEAKANFMRALENKPNDASALLGLAKLAFVEKNFPNHFDLFNRLPKDGPFRNNMVLPKMVQKYRQLMRMEEQNPEAYQVMLTQAKFELRRR